MSQKPIMQYDKSSKKVFIYTHYKYRKGGVIRGKGVDATQDFMDVLSEMDISIDKTKSEKPVQSMKCIDCSSKINRKQRRKRS